MQETQSYCQNIKKASYSIQSINENTLTYLRNQEDLLTKLNNKTEESKSDAVISMQCIKQIKKSNDYEKYIKLLLLFILFIVDIGLLLHRITNK